MKNQHHLDFLALTHVQTWISNEILPMICEGGNTWIQFAHTCRCQDQDSLQNWEVTLSPKKCHVGDFESSCRSQRTVALLTCFHFRNWGVIRGTHRYLGNSIYFSRMEFIGYLINLMLYTPISGLHMTSLFFSPLRLVKIALLLRLQGRWNERQEVSDWWVRW